MKRTWKGGVRALVFDRAQLPTVHDPDAITAVLAAIHLAQVTDLFPARGPPRRP